MTDELKVDGRLPQTMHLVSWAAMYFKHVGFRDEKEWRLVWLAPIAPEDDASAVLDPFIHYRFTRYGLGPYIDWPIAPLAFTHVMIGPRASAKKEFLQAYLRTVSLGHVEIERSFITYR